MNKAERLNKILIGGGAVITIIILAAGIATGHIWNAIALVTGTATGIGVNLYIKKRLNAEK